MATPLAPVVAVPPVMRATAGLNRESDVHPRHRVAVLIAHQHRRGDGTAVATSADWLVPALMPMLVAILGVGPVLPLSPPLQATR